MKSLFAGIIIILAFWGGVNFAKPKSCGANCEPMLKTVNAQEFKLNTDSKDAVVIDVRTPEEYAAGHVEGAVNSDFYDETGFSNFLNGLDKDKKYLIYCRSGNRSGQALEIMKEKGFKNVLNLDGGISSWQNSNFPLAN